MNFRYIPLIALFIIGLFAGNACDSTDDKYEFTYVTYGGTLENADYHIARSMWSGTLATPTKEGYAFAGWYYDAEYTEPFDAATFEERYERHEREENRVFDFHAKWLPADVDVTVEHYWEDVDGTYLLHETTTVGGATGMPAYAPVKLYDFYIHVPDHPDQLDSGTPEGGIPLVLRLYYERKSYVLNFDTNDGSDIPSRTIKFGLPVTEPTPPTKAGYEFGGWYNDYRITIPHTFGTMPYHHVTVYAKWNPLPRLLVFAENGGIEIGDALVAVGYTFLLPVPSRIGYAFEGWYLDPECVVSPAGESVTMPDGPLTLYAKWTIRSYTIFLEENGGSAVEDITQAYGTAVAMPADPTREHYLFSGWYADAALTTPYEFSTMPPYGMTLFAKWEPKMVTMSFVTNGAAAIDPIVVQSGASYALPSPEYADHLFAGWFVDPELTTQHVNTGAMPGEDLTLYAKWYGMTYMIHFDTMGGPYVQDLSLPSGSPLALPTPTREGFTFVGWFDAMLTTPYTGTVMPEGNLVLYAKWAPV